MANVDYLPIDQDKIITISRFEEKYSQFAADLR